MKLKKRTVPVIIVVIFILFLLSVILITATVFFKKNNNILTYPLNNKQYKLLIADTPERWEKGLMYYRKLNGVDGMIFIFPDKQIRSFWNKNTLVDLDLYWLNDKIVLGKSILPSIEKSKDIVIVTSPDKVNKVIEIIR